MWWRHKEEEARGQHKVVAITLFYYKKRRRFGLATSKLLKLATARVLVAWSATEFGLDVLNENVHSCSIMYKSTLL